MARSIDRRTFLGAATFSMTAGPLALQTGHTAPGTDSVCPVCVFTKPLQSLSFDELADRIAEFGFDGLEAPIREGGHMEPAEVPDRLPAMVEALKKRGLQITVMTSSINDPDDPLTETILQTAARLGIRRYRMKYLRYDSGRSVQEQLDAWRPRLQTLAAMNRQFGIRAVYQNHAGNGYLGSAVWDLQRVLAGIPVDQIGVAYDIRHATVEGGLSWPVTFRMIRPHIDTVYVKDFVWDGRKPKNVPLGEGRINPSFFRMLADSGFKGPISLHEEYLDHRRPELVPQHLAAIQRDYATLKGWLREVRLAGI
ncbi:MAG: sugar phosphate isomerase/epimerase family protein [Planctomycetaceae bacterium]